MSFIQTLSSAVRAAAFASVLSIAALTQKAEAITLHFSGLGEIVFDGSEDTFSFVSDGDRDFRVTAVTGDGATGDMFTSFGLLGTIDGVFQIGEISVNGDEQTAPVSLKNGSVPGAFTIWDASNVMLTACVQWIQITTEAATASSEGELNSAGGVLNLTNILYAGGNPELTALAQQGAHNGTASITFKFEPAQSLTSLTGITGTLGTTYIGSLATPNTGSFTTATVPDGGTTAALLGLSLVTIGALARRKTAAI